MGDSWGLETPLWYARDGAEPKDIFSFHRSNDFEHVKAEVKAVRERVGVTEISNFAKYEITGPGAENWLSRMMTNRMPQTGRIVLTPMLNENGKLIGDFTIAKAADEHFYMWGSSQAQIYHMRWFDRHLPADGSVTVKPLDLGLMGLSIAGPNARKLLSGLTGEDVSNDAFSFMSFRQMNLAAIPALVNRLSFTGDLGYEFWVRPEYMIRLHDAIMQAGEGLGLEHFGMRALLSMRLEKHFGTWFAEFRPIYGPYEAGLGFFVSNKKNDFIGRDAAMKEKADPPLTRIFLEIDAEDADCLGDEPIWLDGKVAGWTTSGGYAHHVEQSLAQGYLPTGLLAQAQAEGVEVEIIGRRRKARLQSQPPFDPKGLRMRG